MPTHDDLGLRMKNFYESVPKTRLIRRMPVAIRLDGKAFHTFTRGFQKPFDEVLGKAMRETMKYLCKNIQGCVLGYTQSDEITLILIDYQTLDTCAWYDYEVQKMCSVSASMATMAFNKIFAHEIASQSKRLYTEYLNDKDASYIDALERSMNKGAMFDSRVFNVPKEEVCNLIYWRQLDATRNSIQMVGQANFSHNELQNKSCNDIQDMLFTQRDINWNNYPVHLKRGSCCIKKDEGWVIDKEIPVFKNESRKYINDLILYKE